MDCNVWLIGTGQMAIDYANVLNDLKVDFIVIGRGNKRCNDFEKKIGVKPIAGGIQHFLKTKPALPQKVIVATNVEDLQSIAILLMEYGIKDILLEKPGVAYASEINEMATYSENCQANLFIAYNRRFYSAVLKAEEIIEQDGGLSSFNFEFTEWSHIIGALKKTDSDLHNWFLGNSTHVIDLAFYFGGIPKEFCAFRKGSLPWHPKASAYAGAGITAEGALFSYHANWEAPGRWVLELLTTKHRLIFKPLEKLQIQAIGSVSVSFAEIDDTLDINFKPGLYLQTKSFLDGKYSRFCSVKLQQELINEVYKKMSGY